VNRVLMKNPTPLVRVRLLSSPLHYQFRMLVAERLDDVAVPADRLVRKENFGKLLRPELVLFLRPAVKSQERRSMIDATQLSKTLMAINTGLSLIPIGNNIPQQAILGIGLDLLEALLTTIMPFWPARALT